MKIKLLFPLMGIALMLVSTYCLADCSNPQSTGAMVDCLRTDYKQSSNALERKYHAVLSIMPVQKNESMDWPEARRLFIKGQSEWSAFRENDCKSYFIANGIGQMRVIDELSCLHRHTLRRNEDLDKWLTWLKWIKENSGE
jgi:uncharacterized protein YecT (DUF1311 family)